MRRMRLPALTLRVRWQQALLPLLLTLPALAAGVVAGALATGWLSAVQQQALDSYLGSFFRGLVAGGASGSPAAVFRAAFGSQALLAALAWAGGLFALGLPLTLAALFARGFAIGFTVGFLVAQQGVGGLLLAALALLPASLVSLPALIVVGSTATAQSLRLLAARLNRANTPPGRRDFAVYGGIGLACALALAAGGAIDAYLVPPLLRAVGPALGL